MLGPTINMAQEDPSKAAVFLTRTVKGFQTQSYNALKRKGHRRIHKVVVQKIPNTLYRC